MSVGANLLFFVSCLLVLVIVLYITNEIRSEGFDNTGAFINLASTEAFGMSPGTIDQLSSTHVMTTEDEDIEQKIYNNLTQQGIINMTESGYDGTSYAEAFI